MEWRRDEYRISDARTDVDLDVVHGFLSASYWSAGIPRDVFERSIANAIPFSLWHEPPGGPREQVAFARVVTDRATIAYLGDVFVLEPFRGRGLSKWLMRVILDHPELQGLRRWILATRDAHGLYRGVGFTPMRSPERWMEKWDPDVYR